MGELPPKTSLSSYLLDSQFDQTYSLNLSGNIYFHWADWRQTCLLKKALIRTDSAMQDVFQKLTDEIALLKKTIVETGPSQQSNLYDLYAALYPTPQAKLQTPTWVSLDKDHLEIPFHSYRWIQWNHFQTVLYWLVLNQTFAMRELRLRAHAHVGFSLDGKQWDESNVLLRQLTRHGVLFEFLSPALLEQAQNSGKAFLQWSPMAFAGQGLARTATQMAPALERLSKGGVRFLLQGPLYQESLRLSMPAPGSQGPGLGVGIGAGAGLLNPNARSESLFLPWTSFRPARGVEYVQEFLSGVELLLLSDLGGT